MKKLVLLAPPVAAVVLAFTLTMAAILSVAGSQDAAADPAGPGSVCTVTVNGTGLSVQGEQVVNAQTIQTVAASNGIPKQGSVVGIATAMQESQLINLNRGDRDSKGLFQQRPSQGWGTIAQIMDPKLSTAAFYGVATHTNNPGLLDIKGWESMPVTVAAQAVQRSGFAGAYAQWEPLARAIVSGSSTKCEDAASVPVVPGQWAKPLTKYVITSPFGPRTCSGPCSSPHKGVDLAAPVGTRIYAAGPGKVIYAGVMGTYGNLIEIDHGGGVHTKYAHQRGFTVKKGDTVRAGQQIGFVGMTGRTYGPHTHFEVTKNATPINPVPFMKAKGINL